MSSFKRNLTSIYAVNIFNGVMGIALIPLSLKYLGSNGYGLFSIYTIIASFVALLDAGIGKSLQRILSFNLSDQDRSEKLSSASGAYLLVLVAVIAISPALLVFIPKYVFPVNEATSTPLRWIIVFTLCEYLLFIPLAINQSICFAKEEFEKHARFSFTAGVFRYAVLFAAILLCESVVAVVGIYVLRRIFDNFLSHRIIGSLPAAAWKPRFKLTIFKELGVHAVGLSITRLLQTVLISIGSVLVNRAFGLDALGNFRVAFDLASKVWFVSNGLGLIIYPKLVKAFSEKKESQILFLRLCSAMLVSWIAFTTIGSFAAIFSSEILLKMRISNEQIILLFTPIILGVCINAHANLGYEAIQATGRYGVLNALTLIAIAMMIALFVVLIPSTGLQAIAWAWLLSQLLYASIIDFMVLVAVNQPKPMRARSMAIRGISTAMGLICIIAITQELSKLIIAIAFSSQVIALTWSFFYFRKTSAGFSNA